MGPLKEPNLQEHSLISLGQVLQTLREAETDVLLIESLLSYLKTSFRQEHGLIWLGLYDRVDHRIIGKGGCLPDIPEAKNGSSQSNMGRTIFTSSSEGRSSPLTQKIQLLSGDILEQVVIQQRPLALADFRQEMRAGEWRKTAQKYDIQGTMLFPLCHRDRCIGVLILGSQRWGTFPGTLEKATLNIVLGTFSASIAQLESEWQRQQQKRADKPLLSHLEVVRTLPNFGRRLEAVIEEVHQFLAPSRTSLYWFESEKRYFWRRLTNQAPRAKGLLDNTTPASGITAQEINSFYQQLVQDQIVAIGEAHSSLKADATSRLMQLMRARSLLAAPILYQNQLLGFLAIEGNEPRIWQEEEKQYLRGVGQLIALMAPLEKMESVIQQTQMDQALTTEIARSLYSSENWKVTLNRSAELLIDRLKVDRFMLLVYDRATGNFDVCYQHQPRSRRNSTLVQLPPLSEMDLQLVERSNEGITIENLEDDLRLASWRNLLWNLRVRSVLLTTTCPGHRLEGLLLVCDDTPRAWMAQETHLVQLVAQQLGVILNQWQLQRKVEQESKLHQNTQRAIQLIQGSESMDELEQVALRSISQVLTAQITFLVSWFPGRRTGRLVLPEIIDRQYLLLPNTKVSVHADPLIQMTQTNNSVLIFTPSQIPGETLQWLNVQGMGQILAIALRTHPNDESTGLLCLALQHERSWDEQAINTFIVLASQLAAARRHLKLESALQSERLKLKQISWYKHRHLEELHRTVQVGIQRLVEATKPTSQDALAATRNQQILRQIAEAMPPVHSALLNEVWQMQYRQESVPLLGVLRRSIDRADVLLKQRQIWSQVHQESNPIIVADINKLEMVLYEVICIAGQRSEAGKRIDIWCRQSDSRWVEVAITDDGTIESRLIKELEAVKPIDPLAPSLLNQPPGMHLAICKEVLQAMGAELTLTRLEDGRIMTRLMLPAAQTGRDGQSR